MNARHYRKMRKDFLLLARDAGRRMHAAPKLSLTRAFNQANRQANRIAADRMAGYYPLILEKDLDVYRETCARSRNTHRALGSLAPKKVA
jgi:hypothetical protein